MKPVKNSLFAVLLLSVLAFNTFAGDAQTPGAVAQPSPTPNAVTYSGTDNTPTLGDPYSEQSGEPVETLDYLLFEALSALFYLY